MWNTLCEGVSRLALLSVGPAQLASEGLPPFSHPATHTLCLSRSSSCSSRSGENTGQRQPAKSRIRQHRHRLSAVFSRSVSTLVRGDGMAAAAGEESLVAEDPSELSNHVTAPGILKIFGNEICEGANYKSVLATTHSSARELVKEALER